MARKIDRTFEDDQAGLPLDLSDAIAEFYMDFPEHHGNVFILNHQEFKTGKDAVDAFLPQLNAMEKESPAMKGGVRMAEGLAIDAFDEKAPRSIRISEEAFASHDAIDPTETRARFVIPAGGDYSARVLKSLFVGQEIIPNNAFPVMPRDFNDTAMWQRYALDHELGHAVTSLKRDPAQMKISSSANRAECAADAYAMIRHFQRYGADSKFPQLIRDLRNMNAAHRGDVTHWTARAIDVVIGLNNKGQIANLTPKQARDLASRIADKVQLNADAEYHMSVDLAVVQDVTARAKKENMGDGDRALCYVQAVCLAGAMTQSASVLEVCKRYMTHYAKYIPQNAPQHMTKETLDDIARNLKIVREKAVIGEPEMPQAVRNMRNANIDARFGMKPKNPKPPGL